MNSPQPAWIPALIGHVHECGIRREVRHVEIRHDGDCSHWKGRTCDCEAVIETGQRVERKYRKDGGA